MVGGKLEARDVYISCPKPLIYEGAALAGKLQRINMTSHRHTGGADYNIKKIGVCEQIAVILASNNTGMHIGKSVYEEIKQALELGMYIVFIHKSQAYSYDMFDFEYVGEDDWKRVVDIKFNDLIKARPLDRFGAVSYRCSYEDIFKNTVDVFEQVPCDDWDLDVNPVAPCNRRSLIKATELIEKLHMDKYYYLC